MTQHSTTLPAQAAAHALLRKRIVDLRQCRDPEPSPISRLLAVMRAADPTIDWLAEMRKALAARIERDIAILDALSPDPDIEADYATLARDRSGRLYAVSHASDDEENHDAEAFSDDNGLADPAGLDEQMRLRPNGLGFA